MDPSIIMSSLSQPETTIKLFQGFWALAFIAMVQVVFGTLGLRRQLLWARANAETRAGLRILQNVAFGFMLMWVTLFIPNLLAMLVQQEQYQAQAKSGANGSKSGANGSKIGGLVIENAQISRLNALNENDNSSGPAQASPISPSGKIQGPKQTADDARRSNNALAIFVIIRGLLLGSALVIPLLLEVQRRRGSRQSVPLTTWFG